ncbi:MAG: hypothetical protein HYW62_01700 [Candidatus Levybacteria bacterium]|nr:hypothetical protein [Candidatus Levybacteria bacterium]
MQKTRALTRWVNDPSKVLPKETLLLRKRNHWYLLVQPLSFATLIFFAAIFFISYFFFQIFNDLLLFIITLLIVLMVYINTVIKFLADWYCHFYVLTSRRIMEITYKPLFSKNMNNVIINQVKSTEIDVEMEGMLAQLLDIGSVIVTFDRPTHQQEFYMHSIKDPKSVGFLLTEQLDQARIDNIESPVWVRTKDKDNRLRFIEEIFPGESVRLA